MTTRVRFIDGCDLLVDDDPADVRRERRSVAVITVGVLAVWFAMFAAVVWVLAGRLS